MTTEELERVWVPVPLRWRHVIAGDVFVGGDRALWTVAGAVPGKHFHVEVRRGANTFTTEIDPDDVVNVLVPVLERDAVELSMDELGARLIERRTVEGSHAVE